MSTPRRSQLEWVHRNRQPRRQAERIGALVPRLVDPGLGEGVRHRATVGDCIGRMVDDTFREFCALGKVDKRSVEIIVNHPTAADLLRRQWLMCLVERLDRNCRFVVTPKIQFRVGRGGDPFLGSGVGTAGSPDEGEQDVPRQQSGGNTVDE
ncbi:MAG: hypothetical protein V2A79_10535 [Planctomycetota bacterium]